MTKIINLTKGLLTLCMVFLLTIGVVNGQSDEVAKSMTTKDFTKLRTMMSDEIDLCIMEDTQINTIDEAIARISSYLSNKSVSKYEALHSNAKSGAGSTYSVYRLTTSSDELRVFVFYEKEGSSIKISELRIDKF